MSKCLIDNLCKDTDKCCHFCKKSTCKNRCYHDYTKCRYFESTLFDEGSNDGSDTSKKSKR